MSSRYGMMGKLGELNWSLIVVICLTASVGFAVLYSAAEGNFSPWASAQMLRFAVLLPVMVIIALVDIKIWYSLSYITYAIVLILLIFTEFFGATAMGATRWLRLGPVNVQPSEMMKIAVVFALARYFHSISGAKAREMLYLIPPALIALVPAALVMKQPDLGTALILIMAAGMMFFAAGIQIWKFVVVGLMGVVSIPIVWTHLHDYQKNRILSFLDPESDPLGNGYNILQSKIAIGSGGISGKGFLKGTQGQLSFLPEKQTDFIFTMFTEEFGFVGGATLIFLYAIIIAYGIFIAINSRNHYGRMLAIGVVAVFFLHVCVNIAMVMGMIPIVGAPLPLLSYGGTILMTILVGFGLLLNVQVHRDEPMDRND